MRRCAASAVEPTRRQWQPHTLTSAHAPTPSGSPIRRQARRFCEADIEQILETAVESPICRPSSPPESPIFLANHFGGV